MTQNPLPAGSASTTRRPILAERAGTVRVEGDRSAVAGDRAALQLKAATGSSGTGIVRLFN